MKEGDRNTKYFHNSVKERKSSNKVFSIKNDKGEILTYQNQINEEVVVFFLQNLIGSSHNMAEEDNCLKLLNGVPKLISEYQNRRLYQPVSLEEVKSALSGLGKDKSPGLDGFPALFFQATWDFIG